MRAAPAVEVLAGTGRLERRLIALVHAVSGALLSSWILVRAEVHPPAAPFFAGVLFSAALAAWLGFWLARRALTDKASRLGWDGRSWRLTDALPPLTEMPLAGVWVLLDLGDWKLLQLRTASSGRRLWRVVAATSAGPAWHGLTVALRVHGGSLPGDSRHG